MVLRGNEKESQSVVSSQRRLFFFEERNGGCYLEYLGLDIMGGGVEGIMPGREQKLRIIQR